MGNWAFDFQFVNAASDGGMENIRKVGRFVNGCTLSTGKQVAWIEEAHRLQPRVWDALGTMIEPPRKSAYWIFCTTDASTIPETIKSRCLRYHLRPITRGLIVIRLAQVSKLEGLGLRMPLLEEIATRAGGDLHLALSGLQECRNARTIKEVVDLLT